MHTCGPLPRGRHGKPVGAVLVLIMWVMTLYPYPLNFVLPSQVY